MPRREECLRTYGEYYLRACVRSEGGHILPGAENRPLGHGGAALDDVIRRSVSTITGLGWGSRWLRELAPAQYALIGGVFTAAYLGLEWLTRVHELGGLGITLWNPAKALSLGLLLLKGLAVRAHAFPGGLVGGPLHLWRGQGRGIDGRHQRGRLRWAMPHLLRVLRAACAFRWRVLTCAMSLRCL